MNEPTRKEGLSYKVLHNNIAYTGIRSYDKINFTN